MRNKLCLGLIAVAFLFLGTAMAISFNAESSGSAGTTSFSGNYKLDDSTTLLSSMNLDSGSIFKEMKTQGAGQNSLDESVSSKEKSVQNTVLSSGSMSVSSSSVGSNDGVAVDHTANLVGDMGFIGTKAVSLTNQMVVAGGFEETGALNERINSASGNAAYVGGTVSSAGVDLLNEEIAQAVYSGEMEMEVKGLSMSGIDKIGKFSLVAANQAKAVSQTAPTGYAVGPNGLVTINSPGAGEIMDNAAYMGNSRSYKLLNWKIGAPVQLYLRADDNLLSQELDASETGKSIATAAETWDRSTSKDLFINNLIVSTDAVADTGDGYFVHAFTPIDGSAIAYARTWTSRGMVADSDVCYDSDGLTTLSDGSIVTNSWATGWNADWVERDALGKPTSLLFDVQSLALHELGHTAGMGDLYLINSQDWWQTMNSYNGPQRYLGAGDIAGLQKKYGK